jgi:hypothetical protein
MEDYFYVYQLYDSLRRGEPLQTKPYNLRGLVTLCALIAAIVACGFPPLVRSPNQASQEVRSPGLVKVQIIESLKDDRGSWYLLQADDGQRCSIRSYRGKVKDFYYAWPEELDGYQPTAIQLGGK